MALVEADASELLAAGKGLQNIATPLSAQIVESSKTIQPEWKRLLTSNASTRLEQRVIAATGNATVIENGIRLEAAKTGGTLRGGLSITKDFGAVEYGGRRSGKTTYTRRGRKRGSHKVTRNTTNQLRAHNADGYVFGPAVKAIIPKLGKAWTEALSVTITDTVEGKR